LIDISLNSELIISFDSFRFQSIIRKIIIGFLLLGSLVFNIFSYSTSGFDLGIKMCDLGLMTEVENLSEIFEVLKRLNGLYILIFHFAQKKIRLLVRKKFVSCFQRVVPKKPESDHTAETQ
jgi:hypothetical protein